MPNRGRLACLPVGREHGGARREIRSFAHLRMTEGYQRCILTIMLSEEKIIFYGGTGNHSFDEGVLELVNKAAKREYKFTHIWHSTWPDGEPGFHLSDVETIKGNHVVIFSCPTTFKLESELHDMVIAAKHQYGAKSVTVVMSFMRYRRQDRPELEHEITRLRWFMWKLKNEGVDNLIACEPHSVKHTVRYADEFKLNLLIADPTKLFAEALNGFVKELGVGAKTMIYSPDFGSVERAILLAKAMGVSVLATPKKREHGTVRPVDDVSYLDIIRERFGADVPVVCDRRVAIGKHLIMREDELDSGSTAIVTRKTFGDDVAGFHFVATHPVCSRGWKMKLFPRGEKPPFHTVWLGNTRPRGEGVTEYEGSTGSRVRHVDIQPAIAEVLVQVLKTLE